jgi:hypothetical protein
MEYLCLRLKQNKHPKIQIQMNKNINETKEQNYGTFQIMHMYVYT